MRLSKVGRSNSKKNMSNNFEKTNLIYSTIFEKILNQQISNGIDDKPHVVSICNTSQMAIGLRPRFFLFFEFSRYVLYTWMVILWASIVRKGNCDGCSFDLFLKANKKNRSFFCTYVCRLMYKILYLKYVDFTQKCNHRSVNEDFTVNNC